MNPQDYLNQLFNYALEAYKKADYLIAEKTFRQILKESPDHPDALHFLGISLSQQNKNEKAIELIQKAIGINPRNPTYFNNLGRIYAQLNRDADATKAFAKALEIDSGFVEAYYNRANLKGSKGNFDGAQADLEKVVELAPQHYNAWYNLGNNHLSRGNYQSAINSYQKAIAANPNFVAAHNNLGIVLQEWDRWDEALQHYRKALGLDPQYLEAQRNLARAFEAQGKISEAVKCYDVIINAEAENPGNRFHRDILSPVIHPDNQSIDNYRLKLDQTLEQYLQGPTQFNLNQIDDYSLEPPSNLIYQGCEDRSIKEKFARLFEHLLVEREFTQSGSKIKVGFVVTPGHEGVFIEGMRGIIAELNRNDFEVALVCSLPNGPKILQPAVVGSKTHIVGIPTSLPNAAKVIVEQRFDILYFWEVGTDSMNYFLPFYRLAPVQCSSWGWPITSGIPTMDYFISADHLETSKSEQFYTEKLVKMKRLPVFYYHLPLPEQPPPRGHYGLPQEANIYLCNQNLRKIHPDFDWFVASILEQDRKGMVAFIQDKHPNITDLLKSRIVNSYPQISNRIRFLARMPEGDYLGLLSRANVILDTLHYTGGANTTYDAFAVGTPIVTLPTQYHRGRYTSAAYEQIGITDCVASSKEEYVEIAVRLGQDREYSRQMGQRIKEASPEVFEDKRVVQELEQFFQLVVSP